MAGFFRLQSLLPQVPAPSQTRPKAVCLPPLFPMPIYEQGSCRWRLRWPRSKLNSTFLTLQLLQEREQRTEHRLLALEAQFTSTGEHAPQMLSIPYQSAKPPLVCHPSEKRTRLIPLIEYGARGSYVLICPKDGELHITPDSPEWFAWLASLSSFRFVGLSGRFSARRGYNHRPNRGWYAQRTIHQQSHSKYIGVSEHVTTDRLEHIAAHFQSYLK